MRALLSFALLVSLGGSFACGPTVNPAADDTQEPEIRLPPRDKTSGYDCKDVPEEGKCDGDTAVYCDKRSSTIVSKRCGARDLICEVGDKGAHCVDGQGQEGEVPAETDGPISSNDTGDDCGVYDFIGDCEGNTLNYCTKRDTLYSEDCSAINAVCGFSEAAGYYGCLPPPDCNAEGDTCEGNAIKTCTLGSGGWQVDLWQCDAGETCVAADGFASCESATAKAPTCEDLGFDGKCLDEQGHIAEQGTSTLAYCDQGKIYKVTCDAPDVCYDPDGSGYMECGVP